MENVFKNTGNLRDHIFKLVNKGKLKNLKLLGQEQNDQIVLSWINEASCQKEVSNIGLLDIQNNKIKVLCEFNKSLNIIQASVNYNSSLLALAVEDDSIFQVASESSQSSPNCDKFEYGKAHHKPTYATYILPVGKSPRLNFDLNTATVIVPSQSQQSFAKFLFRQKQPTAVEKLLIFIHREAAILYLVESEKSTIETVHLKLGETLIRSFIWAQWDPNTQTLYYINFRKLPQENDEGATMHESSNHDQKLTPILSALQFHDDLPHESVLNIPFTLPERSKSFPLCDFAVDSMIPFCIHDCSLNICVVSNPHGAVAICQYYIYQSEKPSSESISIDLESDSKVHLAYSITLLHHGVILLCDIFDIPWDIASSLHPKFTIQEDQYIIVYAANLFIHMLDIGLHHEPCCHIMLPVTDFVAKSSRGLLTIPGINVTVDLDTFDLIDSSISTTKLLQFFKSPQTSFYNKISILHYFLVHLNSLDIISEVLESLVDNILDTNNTKLLQEIMVGGTFSAVCRNLPADSLPLMKLLPLTTNNTGTLKFSLFGEYPVVLTQKALSDPLVTLLTPRQRVVPYRGDMWTRLWDAVPISQTQRFKPMTVVDKLTVSLACYQPEALSRCCTPLSPGTALVGSSGTFCDLNQISSNHRSNKVGIEPLPFFEVKTCAASKQEHVISVNLRELSMYLLKNFKVSGSFRARECSMQVHAVATRYAACQLDISRFLCSSLTKAAAISTHVERGFDLIDSLEPAHRSVFFTILEQYALAIEQLAYPFPEGYPSFIAYLGYKSLNSSLFLQYVRANVLELNIDVMKVIMSDLPNTSAGLAMRLRLLVLLPRSRAKRLLNQWHHPVSLMLRAREHSLNILSGVQLPQTRHFASHKIKTNFALAKGLDILSSNERSSPLDTFFYLLTAKANLADLDFNLLIEATMTSLQDVPG